MVWRRDLALSKSALLMVPRKVLAEPLKGVSADSYGLVVVQPSSHSIAKVGIWFSEMKAKASESAAAMPMIFCFDIFV